MNSPNILLLEIISTHDKVNLLLGTPKGNKITENLILDKDGEVLERIKFPDTSNKRFIIKEKKSGAILFIDKKKVVRYE